jgi:hypothetical protein
MIEFGGHAEYTRLYSESGSTPTVQYVKRNYSKVKYVELPLTLKLRTAMIGKMIYWGQFGVGLGYLFSGYADEETRADYVLSDIDPSDAVNEVYVSSDGAKSFDDKRDIKNDLNPIRASLIIALGAEYPISGSTLLSYGITYNGGLLSMYMAGDEVLNYQDGAVAFNNSNKSPVFVDKKILLNQVQLNVGIIF